MFLLEIEAMREDVKDMKFVVPILTKQINPDYASFASAGGINISPVRIILLILAPGHPDSVYI